MTTEALKHYKGEERVAQCDFLGMMRKSRRGVDSGHLYYM